MKQIVEKRWLVILVLAGMTLLGFALRLYRIDQAPSGMLVDELHFGYLAHSLLETGKDEHGVSYPLVFQGFGDNKLPLYAYLSMPSVALFGLSFLGVRLVSILAGTLLIPVSYWLARRFGFSPGWGLVAAGITMLSPWTYFLSRIGFESNLALFFFVLGIALLLEGLARKKYWIMSASGIALGLTWYGYIAYRPLTFLLVLLVSILLVRKIGRRVLWFVLAFGLSVLPLLMPQTYQANTTRFSQVGLFYDPGSVMDIDERRTFCDEHSPRMLCDAAFNKPLFFKTTLSDRFLEVYSPEYMATVGEKNEEFLTIEGYGQFYSILYVFIPLGLVVLLMKKRDEDAVLDVRWLMWLGLLFAPVAAILAGDPQKVRMSSLYPFVLLVMLYGMEWAYGKLVRFRFGWLAVVGVLVVFVMQVYGYMIDYHTVHFDKYGQWYQSYLPDLYSFVNQVEEESLVVIKPFYSDPLMFYAFYSQMHPEEYQQTAELGELEASGFQHTVKLGRVWAFDFQPSKVACEAEEAGYAAGYLVTNDEHDEELVYEGKTTNGVHTLVRVYRVGAGCS